MKKIFAVIPIVLILIGILFFGRSGTTENYTVVSEGGSLELLLSEDHLPPNVSIDDIKISLFSNEESEITSDGTPLITYKLEPDGLQLNMPATIKSRIPIREENGFIKVPMFIHQNDEQIRVLPDTSIIIENEKEIVLESEISHFSELYHPDMFYLRNLQGGEYIIGDSIIAEVKIESTGMEVRIIHGSQETVISPNDPREDYTYSVRPFRYEVHGGDSVTPSVKRFKGQSDILFSTIFTTAASFTCAKEGTSGIYVNPLGIDLIIYGVSKKNGVWEEVQQNVTAQLVLNAKYTCKK